MKGKLDFQKFTGPQGPIKLPKGQLVNLFYQAQGKSSAQVMAAVEVLAAQTVIRTRHVNEKLTEQRGQLERPYD